MDDPRLLPGADAAGAYDRWAATYDTDQNATRDLDARVLRESGLSLAGRDVLELGCGTGKNTTWLVEQAARVIAIDFSEGMIAVAKQRLPTGAVFVRHDVRDPWPLPDASVDVVVGNLVLEHVANVGAVFAEASRVLRRGGVAFFCELHPARQKRGSQAQFTDAASGERVLVVAHTHTESEFLDAARDAGLTTMRLGEHLEDGASDGSTPRLLSMRFQKDD